MHYIDPANDNGHLLFVASVKFIHSGHHILWWRMRLNQCLIYRQRRISAEKFAGNRLAERLINKVIHRSWGENSMATISLTQEGNLLWISGFCICQPVCWGRGNYFLTDFFFCLEWEAFGSEDFGTDSTVLMAVFNRSNGVCGVGMVGIIPLPCCGVYNDPRII